MAPRGRHGPAGAPHGGGGGVFGGAGLRLVGRDPAERDVEPVRPRGGVGVDLETDPVVTALRGVADHGVQQRLGDPAPAGEPVHADVVDIAPEGARGVRREDRRDERPTGHDLALDVELGDPPVVPAVARVLAQARQELREGLAIAVEVVGERLLEHAVHGLEVGGDGQAVVVLEHPPDRHPLARPRQRPGVTVLGTHGPRHLEPGAGLAVAGGSQPAPLTLVVGVGPGVELGPRQVPTGGDDPAGLLGPRVEGARQRVGERVVEARADEDLDEGATAGSVMDRGPADEAAPVVADDGLVARPRARPGDVALDDVRVDRPRPLHHDLVRLRQGDERGHVLTRGHARDPAGRHTGEVRQTRLVGRDLGPGQRVRCRRTHAIGPPVATRGTRSAIDSMTAVGR